MAARARPLGVIVGALVVAAACGFPSVNYTTGDGGGTDGATGDRAVNPDVGPDAPPGDDTRADDGGGMDSPSQDVVSDYVFEAIPDAPECDKDDDKYLEGKYMGMPTQYAYCADSGGNDCDDLDARANPGITQYDCGGIHPPTYGDWNCSGSIEYADNQNGPPIATGVTCNTLQDLFTCNNTSGFVGTPTCGTMATWVQCAFAGTCNIGSSMVLPVCCK